MLGWALIWPGTYVRGIEIGSRTPSAAIRTLTSDLDFTGLKITVDLPSGPVDVRPEYDLGIRADIEKSVMSTRRPLWSIGLQRHFPLEVDIIPGQPEFFIDTLDSYVYREPVNAGFILLNDEAQVMPHVNGIRLNKDETLSILLEEIRWGEEKGYIKAPLVIEEPDVTTDVLDSYMPIEMISTYSTQYQAATDRGFNIELAGGYFKGLVVYPGVTISFNEITGPRTQDQGYRKAPVLIDGRLVDDWGGGICQVSSTLYVALLKAGFEVVERHNHGIPVAYIPMGLDATIAYDLLDLKMKNCTGVPVIIDIGAHWGELIAKVYGRKVDVSIEVESIILEEFPAEVRGQDGGNIEPLRSGFLVETLKYYIKDGRIIKTEKIDTSKYPPEKK